jgi:transposase InsO family protein
MVTSSPISWPRLKGAVHNNGSDFISKAMETVAYENEVALDFLRLGKPTDKAFLDVFNGSFRDECLNTKLGSYSRMMLRRKLRYGDAIIMSSDHTRRLTI